MGYFGLAYYEENRDRLKLLAVDAGKGPVRPSPETVEDGSYYLARPLFIYVRVASLKRPEVRKFLDFFLTEGPALAEEVGYIPLPDRIAGPVKARFEARKTGSLYAGEGGVGKSLGELLRAPGR